MGSVGDFIFGGGQNKSSNQSSSSSSSGSSNQSSYGNVTGSQNSSNQASSSASGSGNKSYGELSAALTPSLGYVSQAGNMMGALLGLPTSSFTYNTPASSVMPSMPSNPAPSNSGSNLISTLLAQYLKGQSAAPTTPAAPPPSTPTPYPPAAPPPVITTPAPTPTPAPAPTPSGGGYSNGGGNTIDGGQSRDGSILLHEVNKAHGGPVAKGKPYIVGEHQPEIFVPKQDGYIVPHVPGKGPDGRVPPPGSPPPLPGRALGGPVQAGQPYVVGEHQPESYVPLNGGGNSGGPIPVDGPGTGAPGAGSGGMGGFNSMLGHLLNSGQMITHMGFGGGGRFFGGGNMTPGGGGTGGPIPGSAAPSGLSTSTSGTTPPPSATPATPAAPVYSSSNPYNPAPANPSDALNTFANSAGMNFILNQGQQAISGASAANGVFDSGATGKALEDYGQSIGQKYLDDYMNQLGNYAKLGLGSASALSGAGGVSQSVGQSAGGSTGSSFGYGSGQSSGQSSGSSSSSGSGTGNSSQKNGLLPDLARFGSSGGGSTGG